MSSLFHKRQEPAAKMNPTGLGAQASSPARAEKEPRHFINLLRDCWWFSWSRAGEDACAPRTMGFIFASGSKVYPPLTPLIMVVALAAIALLSLACTKSQRTTPPVSTTSQPRTALRVCSDPNNLPFSNKDGDGFENKLAEMIAKDLGLKVEYTWWAQRRGFFRNTLKAGTCDVVMGVPASFEMALTTAPYYRSTYVFVSRANRHFAISSFDDPKLKNLRLGVQMVGDDFSNSPPAHALSRRGMIQNVKGYTLYGDYSKPNPPADIIDAVERDDIDVGIAWGPMAGYFARHSKVPLTLTPVNPQIDQPFLPFVFDISMGVRRDDAAFKEQLDRILESHRDDIDKLLDDYGVPRVGGAEGRRVNAKY